MTQIAIVLFEGAEELDLAGPGKCSRPGRRSMPDDGVTVFTVADTADLFTVREGPPGRGRPHVGHGASADVLLVPGGSGVNAKLEDEVFLERLRAYSDRGALVTSVCTGALALAAAGLLRDRPATTWWGRLDRLAELEPTVEVRPDDRFVDSGEIVTAAGVSAGIDMALHLVARLHSVERAREVRRYIQYDPAPPV